MSSIDFFVLRSDFALGWASAGLSRATIAHDDGPGLLPGKMAWSFHGRTSGADGSVATMDEAVDSLVSGRLAWARFLASACLPEVVMLKAEPLGSVTVTPRLLTLDHGWLERATDTYETVPLVCLSAAGHIGHACLFVERRLALAMVNAALGYPMVPFANAPLSRIERGVFEGMLMGFCAGLGFIHGVHLDEDRSRALTDAPLAIGASVTAHGLAGWAYLWGSPAFFEQAWELPARARERALAGLRVELARTQVPRSDVAAAGAGDIVVFDEVRALSLTDPWDVLLYVGEVIVPALAAADGSISVVDFPPAGSSTVDGCGTAASAATMESVQITAELGPLQSKPGTPGTFLRNLSAGTRRTEHIRLSLNAIPWAEGDVLTIDGRLAVRIRKKLAD